jgi:hypothetical protein
MSHSKSRHLPPSRVCDGLATGRPRAVRGSQTAANRRREQQLQRITEAWMRFEATAFIGTQQPALGNERCLRCR